MYYFQSAFYVQHMLSTGHFPQTKLDIYSLRLTCHAVKQNHLVHSAQLHDSKSCVSIKKKQFDSSPYFNLCGLIGLFASYISETCSHVFERFSHASASLELW